MTTELRRLPGPRVCLVPLFISFAFAVGYLMGNRSSPVNVNSDMVRMPPSRASINENGPSRSSQSAQTGTIVMDPRQDPPNPDQPKLVNQSSVAAETVTKAPTRQPLEYEIVVAHYNEPLDWLKPYAQAGHVYHKGNDKGPPFDMYKWEKLPNVGREAYPYLYHIINNYDNLSDVTVFLQGHGPGKEQQWCYSPMGFVDMAMKNVFCIAWSKHTNWGRIHHIGKWLADIKAGRMRPANTTMGEFYTALFDRQPPPSVPRCSLGCFSATRENLRRHPLSFYQKAITFVDDHSNPEEAHYFERLWTAIIYPD